MLFEFRENDLFEMEDGFIKGNMFKKIYSPYKNYKVNENKKINNNYVLDFFINDLELYLLTNPNDEEKIELLSKYKNRYMVNNYV